VYLALADRFFEPIHALKGLYLEETSADTVRCHRVEVHHARDREGGRGEKNVRMKRGDEPREIEMEEERMTSKRG
jgi:hypothetical protein